MKYNGKAIFFTGYKNIYTQPSMRNPKGHRGVNKRFRSQKRNFNRSWRGKY